MAENGLRDELSVYLDYIRAFPFLSAEEERYLGWRIINDKDVNARNDLVNSNLRLSVSIARDMLGSYGLMDLIGAGNDGLMAAANKFDPARGCRFSTQATPWIKGAIRKFLRNKNNKKDVACSTLSDDVLVYDMPETESGKEFYNVLADACADAGVSHRDMTIFMDSVFLSEGPNNLGSRIVGLRYSLHGARIRQIVHEVSEKLRSSIGLRKMYE